MSLDIIAYDEKVKHKKEERFKRIFGITLEEYYQLEAPSREDFAYFTHPNLYDVDNQLYLSMCDEADNIADNTPEENSFHIGYISFFYLRKELASVVNISYITNKNSFDTSINYPDEFKDTELLNFFLHSDCDGEFSHKEIKEAFSLFYKKANKSKLTELKNSSKYNVGEFLHFVDDCIERNLSWDFC